VSERKETGGRFNEKKRFGDLFGLGGKGGNGKKKKGLNPTRIST